MGRTSRSGGTDEIEFLTPDARVFGLGDADDTFVGLDTDDGGFDDDVPRPRWVTVAAGVVVAAVIGAGVVVAAPWADTDPAATTPTTIAEAIVPTGQTAGAGDASTGPSTGWVFDPLPSGFRVADAWANSAAGTVAARGWSEVWATPDATAVDGRWFSVTLLPSPVSLIGEAVRVDLGGRTAVAGAREGGRLWLSAPLSQSDTTQSISIVSSGFTLDELVALARSIGIDDDRPQLIDDRPVYGDPELVEGFELVASAPSDDELIDQYAWSTSSAVTTYASGTPDGPTIEIESAPVDRLLEPLGRLTIGPVRIFPDSASVPAAFTGRDLVIGVSPSGSDPSIIARWHTDDAGPDTTITVRTTIPLGDLFELLPSIRRTTIDEWRAVRRRVFDAQDQANTGIAFVEPSPQALVTVAEGELRAGGSWGLAIDPTIDFYEVRELDATMRSFGDDAPLLAVTTLHATYVIGRAPDETPAGATLRVWFDGEAEASVLPLVEVTSADGTTTTMVAAGAFESFGSYTIELVDADGFVIDTLRSVG